MVNIIADCEAHEGTKGRPTEKLPTRNRVLRLRPNTLNLVRYRFDELGPGWTEF